MLAHHNTAMNIDAFHRNDISVVRDGDYSHGNHHQRELDELETSKERQFMKKTAKFLFSHIGLVGLVAVYAVAGGFLFELLEQHQERLNCQEAEGQQRAQMDQLKQMIVAYINYNTTTSTTAVSPSISPTSTYLSDKDNTTVAYATIGAMLYSFRTSVIDISATYRYSGDDCSIINKWTYPNALLFAITIITTIGYGNITPVTWEGQVCCICYATIGIPIFLLCVANISGVLGEMFRFLYGRVICKPCHMVKAYRAKSRRAPNGHATGTGMDYGGNQSSWAMDEPQMNKKNDMTLAQTPNSVIDPTNMEEEDQQNRQRITVPLTVTMLIIAVYIWAGSLIFHSFEKWTMIQAGYFCFITLSTIGFGDFVPGQQKNDPNASLKLIVGAIYVLFGMAILAMCFDLMQEEIVAKFRWIGRKVGIIEKEQTPVANPDVKAANNANNNNNRRPSTKLSTTDLNSPTFTDGKKIDDDLEHESLSQRSMSGTRKFSPRNNIARVHPMSTSSNEGTLHQRGTPTKMN